MTTRRRLFVHLGLQKTGTTFLQAAMLNNSAELSGQGLDLVPPTKKGAFGLMMVLRDRETSRRRPEDDRATVERFSRALDAAPGSRALFSQESMAAATPRQVERFLGACADREVHVVATVRDLARQIPSLWQERVKAGSAEEFSSFVRRLQAQQRAGQESHPWIHLDPPAVLGRWAAALSPGVVHVVTVPPAGSPTTELLRRFCSVLEIDADRLRPHDEAGNHALGWTQAEVLRRVNERLPDEVLRRDVYGAVGKRFLARKVLAAQDKQRILLPRELRAWCDEVTERQVDRLAGAGYRLVGSLADLACPQSAFCDQAGGPSETEIAAAGIEALAAVLTERAQAGPGRRT